MRHAIDHLGVKGSTLVIRNGKTWLKFATGNQADTSYLINSVQKSMTAAMIMREVQKSKLKLSTKLSRFYGAIPGADKVRISNLLNMTSGLDLKPGEELGEDIFRSDEDNFQSDIKKTYFNPRMLGKWHYTSVNYVYLCGILTQLTHKSYERLFRDTYIKPLHLKQTEFLWSSKQKLLKSNWVPGYEKVAGQYQHVPHAEAIKDAHDELGAGSIVMSNSDLAKVMRLILTSKFLTKQSRKELYQSTAPSYYNGGFYNLKHYKIANGAGEGYYTFFRSAHDGKTMLIVQANHTAKGKFVKIKKRINRIMDFMTYFDR